MREADAACIFPDAGARLQRVQPSQAGKIHAVPLAAPELKNWNPKLPAARQYDFYYPAVAMPHKDYLVLFQVCVALAQVGWRFRLALSGAGIDGFRVNGGFTRCFANPKMEAGERLAGLTSSDPTA